MVNAGELYVVVLQAQRGAWMYSRDCCLRKQSRGREIVSEL
jgi:hypothetical protein